MDDIAKLTSPLTSDNGDTSPKKQDELVKNLKNDIKKA